jgi:hypothetical protein
MNTASTTVLRSPKSRAHTLMPRTSLPPPCDSSREEAGTLGATRRAPLIEPLQSPTETAGAPDFSLPAETLAYSLLPYLPRKPFRRSEFIYSLLPAPESTPGVMRQRTITPSDPGAHAGTDSWHSVERPTGNSLPAGLVDGAIRSTRSRPESASPRRGPWLPRNRRHRSLNRFESAQRAGAGVHSRRGGP